MSIKNAFVSACILLLFVGCVSSGEYKARLDDIGNLQQEVSGLKEKLDATEKEKAGVKTELAEISRYRDELLEENTNLKSLLDVEKEKHAEELRLRDMMINENRTEIGKLSEEMARAIAEKEKAVAELKSTYNDLVEEMQDEIKKGSIEITQLKDKLSLRMVEKILFDSGSATVKKEGEKVLGRVAEILKKVTDKRIRIEGHTDNVPIGSRLAEKFPTNWELSTTRATNVVRYLQEKGGIDPTLLTAAGYSEFNPVASNETDEGRAKNRRIEITLMPIDLNKVPLLGEEEPESTGP